MLAGAITTSQFAKALWPGLKEIYNVMYNKYAREFEDFTYKISSDKNREEYLGFVGTGFVAQKPEGSATKFDSMEQGFVRSVVNVSFGLGFVITREARDDNKYIPMSVARTKALARSARVTKETIAANLLNRAFDPLILGADGVNMISSSHLTKAGLTYSNKLATDADLSEASIEQAVTDIGLFFDERGLRIASIATRLIVHPQNQWEACRILESKLQNDTANNAINVLESKSVIRDGYSVNHYLTDAVAWFLVTDITTDMGDGLIYQERIADEFSEDNEFTTDNAQFKYYGRYKYDWVDARGIFGSAGD